uniref:Uncharacterized protein n=1 Tax=Tanacetum cinerariifolium TaxID=118510 RepID=A0A6L2NKE6_TANCI|nr:hypothetical protein [Tanacetum cinerariifolium]
MTKVIKREFDKLESVKIRDVSLTCNTSLEIFNVEFNRMSRMEDDLFTYEVEIVEVTNIPCDLKKEDDSKQQMSHEFDNDIKYDSSDARGDGEVELIDEESSDSNDEDEVAKIFRIKTNDDWIYESNKDVPWAKERPWTKNGVWKEPTLVKHHCKTFNYKSGCSKWPTYSWKDDGYCYRGNLPGAYIIRNTLCYQDLEWYKDLKDGKLKEEASKNKPIINGMIDEDDESSNEGWKRWDNFDNTNRDNDESENEIGHEVEERSEGFDDHE